MSDTPRTDEVYAGKLPHESWEQVAARLDRHARDLERENAKLRAKLIASTNEKADTVRNLRTALDIDLRKALAWMEDNKRVINTIGRVSDGWFLRLSSGLSYFGCTFMEALTAAKSALGQPTENKA